MAHAGFVLFDRYPIVKRARTVSHMFDFKEVNFARCDPVKACFDMRISFRKTQSWHVLFQKSDVIQHTPCVLCRKVNLVAWDCFMACGVDKVHFLRVRSIHVQESSSFL